VPGATLCPLGLARPLAPPFGTQTDLLSAGLAVGARAHHTHAGCRWPLNSKSVIQPRHNLQLNTTSQLEFLGGHI
jgi:hypothetical protein